MLTRRIFIGAFGVMCLVGCSSQKNADTDVEEPEQVRQLQAADFSEFPMKVEIGHHRVLEDGKHLFEVLVSVENPVSSSPILAIIPDDGTVGVNSVMEYRLDELGKNRTAKREITLMSNEPSFKASVRLTGEGYGVEVHEFYPVREKQELRDNRQALPHPVEVNGIKINSAVEVKP